MILRKFRNQNPLLLYCCIIPNIASPTKKYHLKSLIPKKKPPSFDDGSLSLELLDGGARDSVALGPKPCAAACARNWRMRATGLLAELGGSKAERSRFIGSSHMAMKNADVEPKNHRICKVKLIKMRGKSSSTCVFFSYKVCFLSLVERWMRNSKHQICEITSLIAVSGLICRWIRCMCFATWQISMLRQFLGIVSRALWRASYSWLETHLFKQNDWSTRLWSSVALHSQWLTKICFARWQFLGSETKLSVSYPELSWEVFVGDFNPIYLKPQRIRAIGS